jgi:hypothetical protein
MKDVVKKPDAAGPFANSNGVIRVGDHQVRPRSQDMHTAILSMLVTLSIARHHTTVAEGRSRASML